MKENEIEIHELIRASGIPPSRKLVSPEAVAATMISCPWMAGEGLGRLCISVDMY